MNPFCLVFRLLEFNANLNISNEEKKLLNPSTETFTTLKKKHGFFLIVHLDFGFIFLES